MPPTQLKTFWKFNGRGNSSRYILGQRYSLKNFSITPAMCSELTGFKDIEHYNVKSEAISRQTFHNWPVQFIDKNHLAAAGFYYTDLKDVVCCAFCEVQLGQWKQEDDPFKEHQRWSPSCGFIKGLFVGNISAGSTNQKSTGSRDVCVSWRGKYHFLYLLFCYVCVLYSSPH